MSQVVRSRVDTLSEQIERGLKRIAKSVSRRVEANDELAKRSTGEIEDLEGDPTEKNLIPPFPDLPVIG